MDTTTTFRRYRSFEVFLGGSRCLVVPCLLLLSCVDELPAPAPIRAPMPLAMPSACTLDQALGPPAMKVDGMVAVPIDIENLAANVTIDLNQGTAIVDAKVQFVAGSLDGFPIFDLRQTISEAILNGEQTDPSKIRPHNLGSETDSDMLVLEANVPACSTNMLELHYALAMPYASNAIPATFDTIAGETTWALGMSDLTPGRFLEQWFPANLIHDKFAMTLDIELIGAKTPHVTITNGFVEEPIANEFKIVFPDHFTSQSPMMVLMPKNRVAHVETMIEVPGNALIPLHLYAMKSGKFDLTQVDAQITEYISEWSGLLGSYAHEGLTIYLTTGLGGMEYNGGTTTALTTLRHELFHQWFARGAAPVHQGAGWSDEAMAMYFTEIYPKTIPVNLGDEPLRLDSGNPWTRTTHGLAYVSGGRLLANVAGVMGADVFRDAIASFYGAHTAQPYSSQDLEMHLFCSSPKPEIRALFHRYVYGFDGVPAPLSPDACP